MEMKDNMKGYDYKLGFSELIILTLSFGSILAALHFFLGSVF
ncbi:hypothetical protein [Endozoicomonas euniceicola]|uniref:Uncharacterized protein n=1 Tax=Endozoicomonas euniceicola TaxID=1234143 RepID=A0ABY6H094_9GAMM|nr:hypothetical protein [Endozoicomonas euniceicola]UYM17584.1 hypothetical protein NX720_06650 [Endozoicomonas euniceicola]